jgi:hypothetical protein
MRLTKNFTLAELLASQTAVRRQITEQFAPSQEIIDNLKALTEQLQKIRDLVGVIHVTSGYRCKRLNRIIGGAAKSQHIKGEAADIVFRGEGGNELLFETIKNSGIEFDQLIDEFDHSWIHVSFKRRGKNRKQVLRAVKNIHGKTIYINA